MQPHDNAMNLTSVGELLRVGSWPERAAPTLSPPRLRDLLADALRNHLEARAHAALLGPVAHLCTWSFEGYRRAIRKGSS